jgi:beta-galactosidase
MFFERNIPVDIPSARELSPELLRRYKLVIVPYPILLTAQMASALAQYVTGGGRLFVEARPGWQDDRGHAEPIVPGFGWHRLFGVRESAVVPARQVTVTWGSRQFAGTTFAEQFEVIDPSTKTVATFADGTPAAFERAEGRGRAMILGTFAGERNAQEPVAMSPLGDALAEWAGLSTPDLRASSFVELRRMLAPAGEIVFLFNHGPAPARADVSQRLARPASAIRELVTGAALSTSGSVFSASIVIPAEHVRVFRIDY